jgi:hypothetical protein
MSLRNDSASATADKDSFTVPDESQGRFRIYRLCPCEQCDGTGQDKEWIPAVQSSTCDECRGEGKVRQRVAECPDAQSLGVALVTLGREGEFDECPIGILDTEGEVGQKWLVNPWLPSARNVRDAARTLAKSRKTTKGER